MTNTNQMAALSPVVAGGLPHRVQPVAYGGRFNVVDKMVKPDTDVPIETIVMLDQDCTPVSAPVLKLAEHPGHGEAWFTDATVHSTYSSSNVRSACNSRLSPAKILHYRADAGFIGFDLVAIMATDPTGSVVRKAYRIQVVN